jgi:hypothetical protein
MGIKGIRGVASGFVAVWQQLPGILAGSRH